MRYLVSCLHVCSAVENCLCVNILALRRLQRYEPLFFQELGAVLVEDNLSISISSLPMLDFLYGPEAKFLVLKYTRTCLSIQVFLVV